MSERHDAVEIIVAKRDGGELDDDQIDWVVDAYTRGVVAGDGAYLSPCGRCRQVLYEFGGPDLMIDTGPFGPVALGSLLPGAFGPDDLVTRAGTAPASPSAPAPAPEAQEGS